MMDLVSEARRFNEQLEKYHIVQDRQIDFDRVVAETKRLGEGAAKATPRRGKKP